MIYECKAIQHSLGTSTYVRGILFIGTPFVYYFLFFQDFMFCICEEDHFLLKPKKKK